MIAKKRRGLLTWAILMYCFLYLPIAILIVFSFNSAKSGVVWRGFTLQWFVMLFHDQSIMAALENSLFVALVTTVCATTFGTMAALAMHKYQFRGKAALRGITYIPVIIPEIVTGVSLLSFFALVFTPLKIQLGLTTITIAHIAFCLAYVIIIVQARLHGFDRTLEEASMDLGAGRYKTFIYVTLPVIAPGIISAALLCFTLSIDDFVITFFTQGPNSTTLPVKIYSMVKFGVSPVVNAISTIFLTVITLTIVVVTKLERKE